MPKTSDAVVKVIEAGLQIETVDAEGRASDGLIKIGKALIARGQTPRFTNCGEVSSDSLIKVHRELDGNVVFDRV